MRNSGGDQISLHTIPFYVFRLLQRFQCEMHHDLFVFPQTFIFIIIITFLYLNLTEK